MARKPISLVVAGDDGRPTLLEHALGSVSYDDLLRQITKPGGMRESRREFFNFASNYTNPNVIDPDTNDILRGPQKSQPFLMTTGSAKFIHNERAPETHGYAEAGVYLAPAKHANALIALNNVQRAKRGEPLIPHINACECSSRGCEASCLSGSGQLGMPKQNLSLNYRTAFAAHSPLHFMAVLHGNMETFQTQAGQRGVRPVFRLNGTTDIRYDTLPTAPIFFKEFGRSGAQFNEYTKHNTRKALSAEDLAAENQRFINTPNLHVIHSMHEGTTTERLQQLIREGRNFAVPIATGVVGKSGKVGKSELDPVWEGHPEGILKNAMFMHEGNLYPMVSGYRHDMRFLDPRGVAVGLPVRALTTGEEHNVVESHVTDPQTGPRSFVRPRSSIFQLGTGR